MGRKSTVAALPKELVEACNGLIRDGVQASLKRASQ